MMRGRLFAGAATSGLLLGLAVYFGSARVLSQDAPPAGSLAGLSSESAKPDASPRRNAITEARRGLVNIRFTDESLENAVTAFTKMLGLNIIASPTDLEGKRITVNLSDVEWEPALRAILDMHELALRERTPGSRIYSIAPKTDDATERAVVETFLLNHKTASEIKPLIAALLSQRGGALEFASGNAIVVRASETDVSDVRRLIERIDAPSEQVCVEAKFMELTDEASKQLGIDWRMLEGLTIKGSGVKMDFKDTRSKAKMDEAGHVWVAQDGRASVTDFDVKARNVKTLEIDDDGITRTSVLPIDRSEIRAAVLSVEDFSVVLSALNELDGASTISSPKMIVASGATNAYFSIGNRWPITKTTTTIRGVEAGITDRVLELDTAAKTDYIDGGYLRTGIDLRVVPVVKTNDLIEARIEPKLVRRIPNPYEKDLPWPTLSVKEISTTFTLRNRQTVAIGGLTSMSETKEVSRIPLLGYIPLIGRLFSHTYEAQEQIETIIFVTLSLAAPDSLRGKEGVPANASLVHKKLLESGMADRVPDADTGNTGEGDGQ